MLKQTLTVLITLLATAVAVTAASYYTVRLDDPKAVYLTRGSSGDDDATPSSRRSTRSRRPPAKASSSFPRAATG